jgi:hypothetical protein
MEHESQQKQSIVLRGLDFVTLKEVGIVYT